jgi:hypothetical protein
MLVEKPEVARQIIYVYSFSVHMLLRKTTVTTATAAGIVPENCGKVVPNGGMYTVRSGEAAP